MFQRLMEYVRKFRERGMSLAVDGFRAGGMSMDNASSFYRALGTKPICTGACVDAKEYRRTDAERMSLRCFGSLLSADCSAR